MTTAERPAATSHVAEYMRRPYLMEVVWDEDYWAATFPELPGLVAAADTWDELEQKVQDAKASYFEASLEAGLPIAEPGDSNEPAAGRVLLRLPRTLHRLAARAAARDGVSINTFLVAAIAKELGRREIQMAPEAKIFRRGVARPRVSNARGTAETLQAAASENTEHTRSSSRPS
jgi:antitoxin HicB